MSAPMHTEHSTSGYGFALSEQEVFGLLEDKSPATLVSVTGKIAGAYGLNGLKSKDNKAAEQVFRLLMRETELQVRQTLAEHIKGSTLIPRDIVLTLAHDVASVSLPVLQYSEVLSDGDLLELISNTKDVNRYLAISRRVVVSETISNVLLDKDNDDVTIALVDNNGADISEEKMVGIIANHTHNAQLMKTLSARAHLPAGIAEKLIHVVSTSVGQSLKQKYQLASKDIDIEVDKARESETLKLIRMSDSLQEIDKLVNQLMAFNRLTPSLILSSLCQGNFLFFETSLARLSSIPVANARTLIKDRGDLGFRAIYNKSGLPETLFPAVRLLLRVVHKLDEEGLKPASSRYSNRLVEDILRQSSETPVGNLSYIVALIRRAAA